MDLLPSFEITFTIDPVIRPVPVEVLGSNIEDLEDEIGGDLTIYLGKLDNFCDSTICLLRLLSLSGL